MKIPHFILQRPVLVLANPCSCCMYWLLQNLQNAIICRRAEQRSLRFAQAATPMNRGSFKRLNCKASSMKVMPVNGMSPPQSSAEQKKKNWDYRISRIFMEIGIGGAIRISSHVPPIGSPRSWHTRDPPEYGIYYRMQIAKCQSQFAC